MATKYVELRLNHSLVEKNFEGYKLSLDTIPVFRHNHSKEVLRAKPRADQFSLLHMKLFTMQNNLHMDPWSREQAYFINTNYEVIRTSYSGSTSCPDEICKVFQLEQKERFDGDFNYTLHFISEKYCIICDGIDSVLLLNTGDRLECNSWSIETESYIPGTSPLLVDVRNYIILDARLDEIQAHNQISLALGHIQEVSGLKPNNTCKSYMCIYWATWSFLNNKWIFEILNILEGRGALYYCAFEPKGKSLIISSNSEYNWQLQGNTKVANDNENTASTKEITNENKLNAMSKFSDISWSQNGNEVQIYISKNILLDANETKKDYTVQSTPLELLILNANEIIVKYQLFSDIVPEATKWTSVSVKLEFLLYYTIK